MPNICRDDLSEYCKLAARQLRSGKVEFQDHARAGADVFAVGKSNDKLHEVWNGHHLSLAAVKPPAPPHVATPGVFPDIELALGDVLYVSKRDASVYFDQLRLPRAVRPWFGRPPLCVRDLIRHGGLTFSEVRGAYTGNTLLSEGLRCCFCCAAPGLWDSRGAASLLRAFF